MSHPSGVPDGGGVTGQDPAPVEDDVPGLDAAGVPVLVPPPLVHAATVMSSAHSRASREGRIMTRSVAEVAVPSPRRAATIRQAVHLAVECAGTPSRAHLPLLRPPQETR